MRNRWGDMPFSRRNSRFSWLSDMCTARASSPEVRRSERRSDSMAAAVSTARFSLPPSPP